MKNSITLSLLVTVLMFVFVSGCGKKGQDKPIAKTVTDSTTRDSTAHSKDSLGVVSDSATLAKDSIRIADSLATHPMSYEQRQGKHIYAKYCAVCHGNEGKADGFNTYNLDPKPRDLTEQHYLSEFSDERLIQIIRDGGRGSNKSPSMPPYRWTLGKDDIVYVAAFVRTFMPLDSLKNLQKK